MEEEKLSLNELAIDALRVSAKWCLFLAIIGFIGIGFMVIAGLVMMVAMSAIPSDMGGPMESNPIFALKAYFGVFYIVLAVLYFFPVYYLYNYAKGTKEALQSGNEDTLANALVNLKSHHKFLGILTIILLSVYLITIIGVFVFAASFASGMH